MKYSDRWEYENMKRSQTCDANDISYPSKMKMWLSNNWGKDSHICRDICRQEQKWCNDSLCHDDDDR